MTIQQPEGIYRAMVEDHGFPKLGVSAVSLGIRVGKDILPDQAGLVHRSAFAPGEKNGLSCAPTISSLPNFALPSTWGGLHPKTCVWLISEVDLGAELTVQEDSPPGGRHLSIGPSRTMTFDEFVQAVASTRLRWKKVLKP